MSQYEKIANDKLYHWTINVLHSINLETMEMHTQLFKCIAYLQSKKVLFGHCLDEYVTVRRSAVSHSFIEALTRGRTSHNTNYQAIELYSVDIVRYAGDMLSFIHQSIVFERDMLKTLFKECNQEEIEQNKTITNVLSSITEGKLLVESNMFPKCFSFQDCQDHCELVLRIV